MPQTEITGLIPALDDLGRPQNFGWARSSCITYDHSLLMVRRGRISQSDRYIMCLPTHLAAFEILDDGCIGYVCMSIVSLKDKKRSTETFVTPFPLGSFELPDNSDSGSIKFKRNKSFINFAVMEGGARIIKLDIHKFDHHSSLRGEVVFIPPPDAESLVTHMPWRDGKKAFSYSRRSPWYSVEGVIQFGASELIFTQGRGWGIYEWNRGVRPRRDLRFWASGCGLSRGRQAGFSVGYSSADSSLGTENAFFLEGKLHKLDQVTFHIPSDALEPWRFTSNDNRLEMSFLPNQEQDDSHQMLFYSLKRQLLFGSFSGRVVLDDGTEFIFQDIKGITERWKRSL